MFKDWHAVTSGESTQKFVFVLSVLFGLRTVPVGALLLRVCHLVCMTTLTPSAAAAGHVHALQVRGVAAQCEGKKHESWPCTQARQLPVLTA